MKAGKLILFFLITGLIIFISCKKDEILDADGNIYASVTIGTQEWLAENLKTTRYLNGDTIRTTTADISFENTPKYQWAYEGIESLVDLYGRLYTWYAVVDKRKICPTGWHVPSDAEWEILISNLGGVDIAGGKLKETGTSHWKSPNTGATNVTGFTALPGGVGGSLNSFEDFSSMGFWWSSTQGEVSEDGGAYNLYYKDSGAHYVFGCKKWFGFSVRCIKD